MMIAGQCTPHSLFVLDKKRTGRTRKGYAASVSGKAANGCAAATRCLGSRRGRCPHRPVAEATSTTGQRQRKETQDVSQTSPGQRSPQGQRVSVPDRRAGQPAIPRRRQEVSACADRPAEAFFLFGPCTARFSFGKTKREMGGALPSYHHSCHSPPNGADSRPPPAGANDQYFRASFTWARWSS